MAKAEALTASMHAQIANGAPHLRQQQQQQARRRRQSSAVLPDGVLHVWVYRARRLAFRQHFESMYDRHGLHIRAYLSWRKQCLSRPFESRRNVGGNMTNPVWRAAHDYAPNLMRGHFSVALGDAASPESLPANTELVIEIVCGILVVSVARVALLEFFANHASNENDDGDDGDDPARSSSGDAGIVSAAQQWYPLVGQDAGQLEMTIEFVPASAFDDEDDDDAEEDDDNDAEDDDDDDDEGEDELIAEADLSELGQSSSNNNDDDNVQDPTDLEQQHQQLEQRALTRKTRFECTAAMRGGQLITTTTTTTRESGQVLVSDNGKTTMYIPSQCRPPPLADASSTSVVAYKAPSPPRAVSDVRMDEQLLELYLHGISSDGSEPSSSSSLGRASSLASHDSQFAYAEFPERPEAASMYSRKASTCATDVWSYNELIKDMESSLEAEREVAKGQRGSRAIRKADGTLRHAAPTSDPTSAVPTKSALKKKSNNDRLGDAHADDDDDDDDILQVRETVPKGVVLFDLASIPESLRAGFERCVSADDMTHQKAKKKKDATKGRRRSLPVSSNLSLGRRPAPAYRLQHRAIDEHSHVKSEVEIQAEMAATRRRRSSLHSLADLHARSVEETAQRRRRQQHAERADRGSVLTPQRRNSNSGSVVNIGSAVLGVGKFINIGNVPGVVRYVGPTDFAPGTWIGVELCEKKGKNNGTVRGIKVRAC